jgi:catechol 2,3-dioxygenase-like lactoylglutathione lyase family enzyme
MTDTVWPKRIGALTLFVEDLAATRQFHLDVFGLPAHFKDDVSTACASSATLINLLQVTEAPGLIEPATVGGPDAGARLQLTVEVDDVDAVCARLRDRGVELLNGPVDRPWGVRTAAFRDPAGHVWEVAR